MIYENQNNMVSVTLNWSAYFNAFCDAHGEPLLYRGLLLFQDGWRYSANDYAGPEYPPPTDANELRELKREYWLLRLDRVRSELHDLLDRQTALTDLQSVKDIPLKQSQAVLQNGKDGKIRVQVTDFDATVFNGRISWLQHDVEICRKKLIELEDKNDNSK